MAEPTEGPDREGLYREGAPIADAKAPGGAIETRWSRRKFEAHLVNPANRRKLSVIVVGTGLAGVSGITLTMLTPARGATSPGTAACTSSMVTPM